MVQIFAFGDNEAKALAFQKAVIGSKLVQAIVVENGFEFWVIFEGARPKTEELMTLAKEHDGIAW